MLVDVVLMREGGQRIGQARLAEAEPLRGRLSIHPEDDWEAVPQGAANAPRPKYTVARLFDPDELTVSTIAPGADELCSLHYVRITRMKDREFVLQGLSDGMPQSWWCRIVA